MLNKDYFMAEVARSAIMHNVVYRHDELFFFFRKLESAH